MSDTTKTSASSCLVTVALLGVYFWSWTFAVTHMWAWHIVPLGMQPLTARVAWGASLFLSVFRESRQKAPSERGWELTGLTGGRVIGLWLVVLVSYLIRP